jgi:hypothetical protein
MIVDKTHVPEALATIYEKSMEKQRAIIGENRHVTGASQGQRETRHNDSEPNAREIH